MKVYGNFTGHKTGLPAPTWLSISDVEIFLARSNVYVFARRVPRRESFLTNLAHVASPAILVARKVGIELAAVVPTTSSADAPST